MLSAMFDVNQGLSIGSMLVRDEINLAAALLVTLLILLRPDSGPRWRSRIAAAMVPSRTP